MTDIRKSFGFTTTPFTREIPVERRFTHPLFDEPLDQLQTAVSDRMSAAVISPAGTGKTMLARTLKSRLPEARYRVHYIKTTSIGKRDMCREICSAIGCEPAGQYNTLVRRIQERLLEHVDTNGTRPVIVIDDAHDMRPEVLSTLKCLSNFAMDSRLVVSFILLGNKTLAKMLGRDVLEDVARRLALYATLRNLTRDETRNYVSHRQSIAGAKTDLFTDGSHDAVYEIGGGNLRATDRLCLTSLQLAAGLKASAVDATHVAKARQSLWP
jgi:general secretion pathway protein A